MDNNLNTERQVFDMPHGGTNDPAAMLERAAPFIDGKWRKNIFLMAKLIELRQYMTSLTVMAQESGDGIQMLKAVREELDSGKQNIVDTLIKCMELQRILSLNQDSSK